HPAEFVLVHGSFTKYLPGEFLPALVVEVCEAEVVFSSNRSADQSSPFTAQSPHHFHTLIPK
ncbi:MAG: hypothetical protein ACK6DX_07570, partial [Acidobacteriota bacterium]